MPDSSDNKNIWLAVSLAVITSITSLGTAIITKDTSTVDKLTKKIEVLETNYKDLDEFNQKLHRAIILAKDKIDSCKCH